MRIGFIGTGVMGREMIRNLIEKGFEVTCFNRTFEKAKQLEAIGAKAVSTIEECVKEAQAVITIVGYPKDVEEVYEEIFKYTTKGALLIDMTTSKPSLAVKIYNTAKEKGLEAIDAPVSGGQSGAEKGTLTIMCGGDESSFEKAKPILGAMGTTLNYLGKAGNGQHCKMANQIAIAGTLVGDLEACVYAKRLGLDVQQVYKAITKGAAGSAQFDMVVPKALSDDFSPSFYLKHFIKDMKIAIEESENVQLVLPILQKVCTMAKELEDAGYGDCGTQVLYKYYIQD